MTISYDRVGNPEEIEILRGKKSTYANFEYAFGEQTMNLLKKNIQRADSFYLIAKDGDVFVGFCSVDSDWWEPHHFFLREIFIVPKYQGQHVGETLMQKCIDYAKEKNAKAVVTETAFENIPMQKLCQKLGFQIWDNPQWKEGITYKLPFERTSE